MAIGFASGFNKKMSEPWVETFSFASMFTDMAVASTESGSQSDKQILGGLPLDCGW